MTIKREELDRREIDFSDVASGQRLPPVHPGEILRDEFLIPLEISVYRLAQAIKVSRPRLNDIVLGRRSVTTDTALRLGHYLDTTPEFWINLQTRYDLDVAERTLRRKIEQEIEPLVTLDERRAIPPARRQPPPVDPGRTAGPYVDGASLG